jgi:hypothetical protein
MHLCGNVDWGKIRMALTTFDKPAGRHPTSRTFLHFRILLPILPSLVTQQ